MMFCPAMPGVIKFNTGSVIDFENNVISVTLALRMFARVMSIIKILRSGEVLRRQCAPYQGSEAFSCH